MPLNNIKSKGPLPEKKYSSRTQPSGKMLCRFFAKGSCNRGDDCRFSHNIAPNGPPCEEAKTKTRSLQNGQASLFQKHIHNATFPENHSNPDKGELKAQEKLSFKEIQAAEEAMSAAKDWQPNKTYSTVVGQPGKQSYKVENDRAPKNTLSANETTPHKKSQKPSYSAIVAPPSIKVQTAQGDGSEKKDVMKPISEQAVPSPGLPNVKTTNLGIGASWDFLTLKKWAYDNLRPEVMDHYLKKYGYYLDKGVIPVSALEMDPTKPRSKVRKAKFRNFGRLPFELREKIWNYALDRVKFDCRVCLRSEPWNSVPGLDPTTSIMRRDVQPEILRINHELREIALKRWKLRFPTKTSELRHCYFNFHNDRLFINGTAPWHMPQIARAMLPQDRCRIRAIAVPLRDYVHGDKDDFIKAILLFKSLRQLWIVVGDSKEDEVYSTTHFARRVWERLQKPWDKVHKNKPMPHVWKQIIPALRAKYYGIDGLIWDSKNIL